MDPNDPFQLYALQRALGQQAGPAVQAPAAAPAVPGFVPPPTPMPNPLQQIANPQLTPQQNPLKVAQLMILAATEPEKFAQIADQTGLPAPKSLEEVTGGPAPSRGRAASKPAQGDPVMDFIKGLMPQGSGGQAQMRGAPGAQVSMAPPENPQPNLVAPLFNDLAVAGSVGGAPAAPTPAPMPGFNFRPEAQPGVQMASTADPRSALYVPQQDRPNAEASKISDFFQSQIAPQAPASPAPQVPAAGGPTDIVPQGFAAAAATPSTDQTISKLLSGVKAPAPAQRWPSAGVIGPRIGESGLLELLAMGMRK